MNLIDPYKVQTRRIVSNGLVEQGKLLLTAIGGIPYQQLSYQTPSVVVDAGSGWTDEALSIDGDNNTKAFTALLGTGTTQYLSYTYGAEFVIKRLRVILEAVYDGTGEWFLKLYRGGVLVDGDSGEYEVKQVVTITFASQYIIDEIRISFQLHVGDDAQARIYEVSAQCSVPVLLSLYDGFGTNYEKKISLPLKHYDGKGISFFEPMYFSKGLYAAFTNGAKELSVSFMKL